MKDLLQSPHEPRTRPWFSESWRRRPSAKVQERWLLLFPLVALYLLYIVSRFCAMPVP